MAFGIHTIIGLVTVSIAIFALFYVFYSIESIVNQCRIDPTSSVLCPELTGFTLTIITILLVIGGFILIISTVAYILLTA